MPLPAVVESLDEIPEIARDEYRQDADGKRFIREAVAGPGDDLAELKRALEREKAERRKFARLAEERGSVDPEEYKALKAAQEAREREEAERKGHFDKIIAQKDSQYQQELSKRDADLKAALSAVEKYVLDAEIAQAVSAQKGKLKILAPHVKAQLKAINEGGQYRVAVIDADGDERFNPKTNAPMTVAELVAEMRLDSDYEAAFEASGATGGGASGAASTKAHADLSKLNPLDRLAKAFEKSTN